MKVSIGYTKMVKAGRRRKWWQFWKPIWIPTKIEKTFHKVVDLSINEVKMMIDDCHKIIGVFLVEEDGENDSNKTTN